MKKALTITFLTLALILVLAFALFPLFPVLSISNRKNPSERIYFTDGTKGFVISYTHSVNKGRVHDYYRTEGRNLVVYRTDFVSYGAGMPELEETPGAVFRKEDGTYSMEYHRNVGKAFLLSVGVIAEHSITVNGNEFFLKDFFKPKTSLVIEVKKISMFNKIKRRPI